MGIEKLTMATMGELDHGAVAVAADRAITVAVRDCIDRPGDERARIVTVKLAVKPRVRIDDGQLSCEGASGGVVIGVKVPGQETNPLDFGVKQDGSAVFAPECPENHAQGYMFDDGVDEVKDVE